jgi:acetyl esterase
MTRDRSGPPLAGQLLLYPVIGPDFDTVSYQRFGRGYYNPREAMRWYWDQYVPNPSDRLHPYASPLSADLSGVAPAVIVLNGHDPLRDEGAAYADALAAAGVPTVRCDYDGAVHGFMTMPMLDIAHEARRRVCTELARLLDPKGALSSEP